MGTHIREWKKAEQPPAAGLCEREAALSPSLQATGHRQSERPARLEHRIVQAVDPLAAPIAGNREMERVAGAQAALEVREIFLREREILHARQQDKQGRRGDRLEFRIHFTRSGGRRPPIRTSRANSEENSTRVQ